MLIIIINKKGRLLTFIEKLEICTLNTMKSEESISLTLILFGEVILFLLIIWLLVPTWKAPAYNSPYYNWKRGMYAMSTALFIVKFLSFIIRWNLLTTTEAMSRSWISFTNGQEQDQNTIYSLKKCLECLNSGLSSLKSIISRLNF